MYDIYIYKVCYNIFQGSSVSMSQMLDEVQSLVVPLDPNNLPFYHNKLVYYSGYLHTDEVILICF